MLLLSPVSDQQQQQQQQGPKTRASTRFQVPDSSSTARPLSFSMKYPSHVLFFSFFHLVSSLKILVIKKKNKKRREKRRKKTDS
jgi:hypothetical protein